MLIEVYPCISHAWKNLSTFFWVCDFYVMRRIRDADYRSGIPSARLVLLLALIRFAAQVLSSDCCGNTSQFLLRKNAFPRFTLYHRFALFSFQGTIFEYGLLPRSRILLCKIALVEMRRIELLTPCLQGRCSPS